MRRELTPRQTEIVGMVAGGLGDKEIAARLGVSASTVRTHLQRLYRDHGIHNRAEAAAGWVAFKAEPESVPPASVASKQLGHQVRATAVIALALAIIVAGLVTGSLVQAGSPQAGSGPRISPARAQLQLFNAARDKAGQPPLQWDECLAGVAADSARRLAALGYVTDTGAADRAQGCSRVSTQPTEIAAYWSAPDDPRLNALLLANPESRSSALGAFDRMGAAWAVLPSPGIAYLVVIFS